LSQREITRKSKDCDLWNMVMCYYFVLQSKSVQDCTCLVLTFLIQRDHV